MKLEHVTIQTSRFEEEIQFYKDIVGLSVRRDLRPIAPIVFVGDDAVETSLEIINIPEALDSGNPYLSIGFETGDVEAKRAELDVLGLDPTPIISPNPQVKFFYVKDPAGVRVQFIWQA